ncbi:MAG: hypothetical protein ACLP59_15195 [Bryobacteraceae bacterium]
MFRTDSGKDRWQLGFKDAALSSFEFLRTYGLKSVGEDVTLVRYESDAVFVNVYHGRGSFEIGVEIGRLDRPEKYGLDYIVSWAGKQAWEAEGFGRGTMFQVSTLEGVQNIVPKVAQLVKKYGDPFLSGRPAFYDELQKANERASVAFEREQMLSRIRKEADAAWTAKDFPRVAELLQPVRSDLTEVESKRLAYAEKQIGSTVHEEPGKHR